MKTLTNRLRLIESNLFNVDESVYPGPGHPSADLTIKLQKSIDHNVYELIISAEFIVRYSPAAYYTFKAEDIVFIDSEARELPASNLADIAEISSIRLTKAFMIDTMKKQISFEAEFDSAWTKDRILQEVQKEIKKHS